MHWLFIWIGRNKGGTETPTGSGATLRFERISAHPPEKSLGRHFHARPYRAWLQADATVDLHQGRRFHLAFHNFPHVVPGKVLRCTRSEIADYAYGWHWHLDGIAASIAGDATAWQDGVWRTLKQAYEERFSVSAI